MCYTNDMKIVSSVSGALIRLTAERVGHIIARHPEMIEEEQRILDTVESPDLIQKGDAGTLIALKHYSRTPLTEKYCAVVYRELNGDGFILTAYFTSKPAVGRRITWQR